jgi:HlyD family secretion protein
MWKWLLAIVVIGALGVWSWTELTSATPVRTAVVRQGALEVIVEERAVTRLPETYRVATPFDGRIMPVTLVEGDSVAAGQIVAQMNVTELTARMDEQRAAIARLDAQIVENDDARIENTLIEQINALLVSIDRAVESAEEQTRSSSARLDYLTADSERVSQAYEQDAATQRELEQAELARVEGDVSLRSDMLILRATEAVRVAARIGPRFINEMIERKALSRSVLERQRDEANARLAQLQIDLDRANIPSPVDGVVLRRRHSSELPLPAGEVLLEIGRLEDLEVEIEMLTEDAATVSVGDRVEIFGDAIGIEPLVGAVKRIYPEGFTKISSLGVEQQRVLVIATLPNDLTPAPGQSGRELGSEYRVQVRVVTETIKNAIIAPRASVFRTSDGSWRAFVVSAGRARLVPVRVDAITIEGVEIREGLHPGDTVVLAPPTDLNDGARVRPDN